MIHLKTKTIISLILAICLVFASSSFVKADEDDFPDASNTSLAKTQLDMYYTDIYGAYGEVALVNPPELYYYDFDYECSNPMLDVTCALDVTRKVICIRAYNTGSARITFTLNNKTLYLDIRVIKVSINKTSLLIVKKKKKTIKIKGYTGTLKWVSKNKKVASVTSSGVIKGKKIGNTLIYTNIGGQYFGCAVSVVSKKMNTIVKKAYSIKKKSKYSQARRMQKGYYDCSSLVWRSYKKGKVKLVTKYYAPVAADIAKYYVKVKKKRIKGGYSKKNVANMKLRPGDLFFCEGARNGRYRGIYHVEMFTGYRCVGIDPNGTATIVARWATVPDDYYMKAKGLMVRPIK